MKTGFNCQENKFNGETRRGKYLYEVSKKKDNIKSKNQSAMHPRPNVAAAIIKPYIFLLERSE